MRIQNNITAVNSHRQYNINNRSISKNMEQLSSGFRVNRAADDAAGLAISEKMRAQIRGLNQASRNSQDAISLVQTAEGGMQTIQDILQRVRELAVQAASDTNQDEVDREALDLEVQQLLGEIDDISGSTEFNRMPLLNGEFEVGRWNYTVAGTSITPEAIARGDFTITYDSVQDTDGNEIGRTITSAERRVWDNSTSPPTSSMVAMDISDSQAVLGRALAIQIGANSGQTMTISIQSMNRDGLQLRDARNGTDVPINVLDRDSAEEALNVIDAALGTVSMQRAELGAFQNRLEFKVQNLDNQAENVAAAEARIRDADMAKLMTEFTKNNILFQASTAMLAQANALPQGVLQLLG